MQEKKENRTVRLTIRFTPDEYTALEKKWKQSTCHKLSDYARRILFGKGLVGTYRNLSLDEFMGEMIALRKVLNGLANNYNQAVKRLHTIDNGSELRSWIAAYDLERKILANKVEEVKAKINKFSDVWLQK